MISWLALVRTHRRPGLLNSLNVQIVPASPGAIQHARIAAAAMEQNMFRQLSHDGRVSWISCALCMILGGKWDWSGLPPCMCLVEGFKPECNPSTLPLQKQ